MKSNCLVFLALCLWSPLLSAASESAKSILKKTDEIRSPSDSYKLSIEIETKGEETLELEVSISSARLDD